MYSCIRNMFVMSLSLVLAGCAQSRTHSREVSQGVASPPPEISDESSQTARIVTGPRDSDVMLTSMRDDSLSHDPRMDISFEEFRAQALNDTAIVIDARTPDQFEQGHVRGAINIPAGQKEIYTDRYLRARDHDQLIMIYCNSAACHASDMLGEYLQEQGFTNVRVFSQGWLTLAHAKDLR